MTGGGPPLRATGRIWISQEAAGPVLFMAGEIDAVAVANFEADHAQPSEGFVAVDAEAVTFLNSSGVAFLARRFGSARRALLRRPSRTVRRILTLTGVIAMFDLLDL